MSASGSHDSMQPASPSSASGSPAIRELLPARMVNEFVYCPRLAYLEWVQGEFAHSADTLDGAREHRRVDKPGGEVPPPGGAAEPDRIHARSVHLSAPKAGLVAVIDLLEGDADPAGGPTLVTPVDYKRGEVPEIPGRAWEPDRVQLCAQGLILRENGYRCERGVVYYVASKTRVEVAFDDGLVARTLEAGAGLRALAESGRIPPPLVDSPKCPRCSLVSICLPDETRLLAGGPPAEPAEEERVRLLVPDRDDTRALYVQSQGAEVGKKGDVLEVRAVRGSERLAEVRLPELSHVALFGSVRISPAALQACLDGGIPVAHFSFGGWFRGLTTGLPSKNVELRQRQYAAAADPARSLDLARRFVAAKVLNQRTMLRRNHPAPPEDALAEMKRLADRAAEAADPETLLGFEGNAARAYFANFGPMLKPRAPEEGAPLSFDFEGRNRRPPVDPVNAMLSYAYAMLTKDLTVACWVAGLDPFLGFFHRPRYGRPALALDLMEEFRAIVADSAVLTAVGSGEVGPTDFIRRGPAVNLAPDGRKRFLSAYERRLDSLVTHPVFGYRLSYRRVLELQTRLLGRTLLGEIREYVAFTTR